MPVFLRSRFVQVNTALWLAYTGVSLFLSATYVGMYSGVVLICVLLGLSMWVASSGIRHVATRQGWFERDTTGLAVRIAVAVALAAVGVQVVIALGVLPAARLGWVRFPASGADYRPGAVVGYWINTVVVLGAWSGAWVGWRALRRARHSEIERLRAETERRALELDALRARLNPHFVFNALNNLRALINEDTERARELVTRLSSTLRHALEHHAGGDVRLAEELGVVDDYLAVESVHYESRLQVRRDIAPAALDASLPPMLLQLMVENAIKHGIACTPRGGTLVIAARVADDTLQLEVINPGALESGTASVRADGRCGGVGLAYLRAQLQSRPRPGRFALSAENGKVRALLEIPQ